MDTAYFYKSKGINIKELLIKNTIQKDSIFDTLHKNKIEMIINISSTKKNRTGMDYKTFGYMLRRTAVNYSIPILTDIKQAKLFVKSL